MLRIREKIAVYKAKREASGETNPIDTMILNIWPSEVSVDQAIQCFFYGMRHPNSSDSLKQQR